MLPWPVMFAGAAIIALILLAAIAALLAGAVLAYRWWARRSVSGK